MELTDSAGSARFVFDDHALLDANDQARALIDRLRASHPAQEPDAADDLGHLIRFLLPHFPQLHTELADLVHKGRLELTAADDSGYQLQAEWRSGLAHLALIQTRHEGSMIALDRLGYAAMEDELETLRHCAGQAPILIWRTDSAGNVVWANGAYLSLAAHAAPADSGGLTWPLPQLFARADNGRAAGLRAYVADATEQRAFDLSTVPATEGAVHYAIPADAAARSEGTRRELLQTLARAFSTLPVGLAVFDSARRLQIFNPALVDLTGLCTTFLAGCPSLDNVLHALREARVLPEPRDYKAWRADLIEIERAAGASTYSAEWILPDGQTLNVTGRPHPDGGLAFFFEDVTSEIRLARGFRSEIETGHAVLDAIADPLAVFSAQGALVMANAGYHRLWNTRPDSVIGQSDLADALAQWHSLSQPGPVWDDVAGMVRGGSAAAELSGTVALRNGRALAISARTLPGRQTLVTFAPAQDALRSPAEPSVHRHHDEHADLLGRSLPASRLAPAGQTAQASAVLTPSPAQAGAALRPPRTARVRHVSSRSGTRG